MRNWNITILYVLALMATQLLMGCASTYAIETEPSGAQVSLKTKDSAIVIGQTPLDFSSSQLPDDQNFILEFSKPGFESKEVEIMPVHQSRTQLKILLETAADMQKETDLKKNRALVSKIFSIQELVFRKKYVDALTEIRELEKNDARLPEVYVLKGSVYFLMNDLIEAKNAWKQALKLDPNLDSIKLRVAEIDKKKGSQQ